MKTHQDIMDELLSICRGFGIKTINVNFEAEGPAPERKVIYLGYEENGAPAQATWLGNRWYFGYGCRVMPILITEEEFNETMKTLTATKEPK